MPKIMRNLILLQEDCGEVCDTSDEFKKIPGNPFDTMKKEFECDILLTSPTLNPPLGAKYLVFVSSRSVKTRELSFAQFVEFLRKVCLFFNF